MKTLLAWLEDRTGWVSCLRSWLWDPIPGGARWRYTWWSLVLGAFLVQAITGFFLWTHYSPSTSTAWESVHHLQTRVAGGWLLRGMHHFGAQAFVVLLGVHLVQLVISRMCRVPGEMGFWAGLLVLPLAVGLSVTGWMLPFDQHGFWAARVPLNLLSITPVAGESMRVALLGGVEVSHSTLTRFLALHAGLLPALVLALVLSHWTLSWRRVRRQAESGPFDGAYWPDQAWRDAAVVIVFVGLLVAWVVWRRGAPLGAPADPTEAYAAARPEWFFLWLFQLLKFFRGGTEVWGAVVLPAVVMAWLAATPWIAASRGGHRLNVGLALILLGAVVALSVLAWREDRRDPVFQEARLRAEAEARRVDQLVARAGGVPPEGARSLVGRDPWLQGPKLFARHCAACHRYDGHDGMKGLTQEAPSASDLYQFASRNWLTGLLHPQRVAAHGYFGGTAFESGKMVRFVKRDVAEFNAGQREQLRKVVAAISAEAALPRQRDLDAASAAVIEEGRTLVNDYDMRCTECHRFRDYGEEPSGPDLTGYGSRDWMIQFIRDPAHERFYGERNDRMPRFGADAVLERASIELIVDWLREDWGN